MKNFTNLLRLEIALENYLERLRHETRSRPMILVDGDATIDVPPLWDEAHGELRSLLKCMEAVEEGSLDFKDLAWSGLPTLRKDVA